MLRNAELALAPGEAALAYTDGATDVRRDSAMLGLPGLSRLLTPFTESAGEGDDGPSRGGDPRLGRGSDPGRPLRSRGQAEVIRVSLRQEEGGTS